MTTKEKKISKEARLAQINCQLYSVVCNLDKDVDADKEGRGKHNRYTGGESAGFLQYFCKDKNGRNIKTEKSSDDISVEDIISTPAYQTLQKKCSTKGFFIDVGEQPVRTQDPAEEKNQVSLLVKVHGWKAKKKKPRGSKP